MRPIIVGLIAGLAFGGAQLMHSSDAEARKVSKIEKRRRCAKQAQTIVGRNKAKRRAYVAACMKRKSTPRATFNRCVRSKIKKGKLKRKRAYRVCLNILPAKIKACATKAFGKRRGLLHFAKCFKKARKRR